MISADDTEFTLTLGSRRALVSSLGASLRRYYRGDGSTGDRDLIWPYSGRSGKRGAQGDVLVPFPGRIKNGRYSFNGQTHELERRDKDGPNAIHGFVRDQIWVVSSRSAAAVEFRYDLPRDAFVGYPYSLEVKMKYELTEQGLTCAFAIRNTGPTPAPVAAGFHPYFTAGTSGVDDVELLIPAAELVEFGPGYIPTGKIIPVAGLDQDYSHSKPVRSAKINHCYTGLKRDPDGMARALVRNPRTGEEITIWMDKSFPYIVVFTGDTIPAPDSRKSIAVEPMTCGSDAFNHPEWGSVRLDPGATMSGRFGISENEI